MGMIAEAVKHMLAAGMPPDSIVEAVRDMEASMMRDDAAERRRARDRVYQAEKREKAKSCQIESLQTSADSADSADNTPPSLSPSLLSPHPPQITHPHTHPPEKNNAHTRAHARGTRLAIDFELPEDWREWAVSQGMATSEVVLEAERFADYWHAKAGKDAIKLDWTATWRNWCRNRRRPGRAPPPPEPVVPL